LDGVYCPGSMMIQLKRIYEQSNPADGYRVLIDRLWPRGLTKEQARLDEWAKDIAPSNELRKWFHADRTKWVEFKRKYRAELKAHQEPLRRLAARAANGRVTLLYASTDSERNHAVVVADLLHQLETD
jgi:uncharacterized protein YeaO (DUF488 family)